MNTNQDKQSINIEWQGYDASFKRLEQIVQLLERGELPLEQAISLFHEGMNLSNQCSVKLDEAEQQIEKIIERNGAIERAPLPLNGKEED